MSQDHASQRTSGADARAPGVPLAPVADPVAARAACSARVLEREGIPVVLALLDARPGAVGAEAPSEGVDGGQQLGGEGPALATLLDTYAAALVPGAADDDPVALYSVVELIGYLHVRPATGA